MDLGAIVEARIHPSIGVARIGNSNEFFVGPEVPHPVPPPPGGYRDPEGGLKRQAALFRVYGYDAAGAVVAELTASNADIVWTAHVVNKKAAWYDFDAALDLPEATTLRSPRRNSNVPLKDRHKLIIDPGPRSVTGKNQKSAPFDTGKFFDETVYLGELRTDDEGRLLFLGGKGKSRSPFTGFTLTTFANNPGWHDDTSDGPVSATVTIAGRSVPIDPAWVVTAPPNYSPDLVSPQTMHDVITDALIGSLIPARARPSFAQDILPLLSQFHMAQWVNFGFFVQFGWRGPNDFLRPDYLSKLAAAPGKDDPYLEVRKQVFYSFRDPGATQFEPLQWPPIYGDAFGSYDSPPVPRDGFAVTNTLYQFLGQWMRGDFIADYDPNAHPPQSLDDVPVAEQPATLDRASLHWCMGGPFHPGCEMTWPMRQSQMYRAPYRIRQRPDSISEPDYGEYLTQAIISSTDGPLSSSAPGDITKWMAVPWQADTASCRAGYPNTEFPPDGYIPTFWPSRVPNTVLTEEDYRVITDSSVPLEQRMAAFYHRPNWLRSLDFSKPYVEQITKMVYTFGDLGLILRREDAAGPEFPAAMFVESLPPQAAPKLMAAKAPDQPPVTQELAEARFGGLRRRHQSGR